MRNKKSPNKTFGKQKSLTLCTPFHSCINFEIYLQVHVCSIMHKSVTQPTFIYHQNKDKTCYAHALLT